MRKGVAGIVCLCTLGAQANVIQFFAGINYNNASELFKVKKSEFIIGGTGSYANLRFKGSVLNFNTFEYGSGTNYSRTYTLMPYGRLAKRVGEKTVVAVDVTQPFNSNLDWGDDAFTRYANTQNYLTNVDVSPKIAYSLTKNLQLGGGVNLNFLTNNEVNWALPTGQFTSGTMVTKSTSFGLGYNFGLTYVINQTNFVGFTYYSRIRQNTKGVSYLGSFYSGNFLFGFYMPATAALSYVHLFNPKWLISLQAYQSGWNANQYIRLYNTAAPPPLNNFTFNMHFDKSYAIIAALRNQFTDNLGLTLVGVRDDGPEQNRYRTITFPAATQYLAGLMADYHFTPHTSVELLYGHLFSNMTMQNHVRAGNTSIPFTTGFVNINVDVIDLKLKISA